MRGRGAGRYRRGKQVPSFDEISAGMLLIDHSLQFDAVNLIRVTSLDSTGLKRRLFNWRFVAPSDGTTSLGDEHAMWAFEFEGEGATTRLYLPVM